MERPLAEVIESQQAMLRRLGHDDQGRRQRALARAYVDQLSKVRSLLLQAGGSSRVLAVNYQEALSNPAAVVGRVNRFLGGELDIEAMAAAIDPSMRREFASA